MKNLTFLLIMMSLLAACAGDDMGDLKQFIDQTNAKKNSNVPPLPEFTHIPSYFYEVENMRNPFIPFGDEPPPPPPPPCHPGDPKCLKPPPPPKCPHPYPHRVRAGLELMPLDSLKMVGTLEANQVLGALIQASDGTIYPVRQGDFVGLNYGKVTSIDETKMELQESIPNREDCWDQRVTPLLLNE